MDTPGLSDFLPETFLKWLRRFTGPLPEDINEYLSPGKSFMDVGAGNGYLLSTITPTKLLYAVEVWDKKIDYLKRTLPTVTVFKDIYIIRQAFDVVANIDVLHHISDNAERRRFLKKLFSIVVPGGVLIIKEMRDDLLFRKYFNRFSDFVSTGSRTKEMNARELIDGLEDSGFKILRFIQYTAGAYGHYYIVAQKRG
ncbi:MAG: methyltransferase domain-containing protein [Patescibacteria group bacterium]|mgnify:CR=1 FL=1